MMQRQVRLNKAYSHLGWEPLLYLGIYDKDDTADYSLLLKRIGHGQAPRELSVCICVYEMENGSTVTQFSLTCSSLNLNDLHHQSFPWTSVNCKMTCGKSMIE